MANDERDAQLDGHKLSNLLQSFTSSGDRKVVCDGCGCRFISVKLDYDEESEEVILLLVPQEDSAPDGGAPTLDLGKSADKDALRIGGAFMMALAGDPSGIASLATAAGAKYRLSEKQLAALRGKMRKK